VTYTGTIASGFDGSGVFGQPGPLTGASYVASYLFDDTQGKRTTIPPYLDSVIGGDFNGDASPSLGATLTIHGVTVTFGGNDLGLQENFPLGGTIASYSSGRSSIPFDASYLGNELAAPNIPSSMDVNFHAQGGPGNQGFINGFQFARGPAQVVSAYAAGTFAPESVSVTVASAAPEPANWTLAIVGIGLTGMAARRRRPKRTA
jgi:hypothetical protein